MKRRKTSQDEAQRFLIKAVTEAHTDLTVFASIVAILEGGTVSARVQPDDFKVIALCQKAQQKCLRRYDRAVAALTDIKTAREP